MCISHGSGHGNALGIYTYELYNFYDVDEIIRIGSAGGLQDDVNVMDVVIALGACTDSNYASQFCLPGTFAPTASYELVEKAVQAARKLGTPVRVGNVMSSDAFYNDNPNAAAAWRKMGVLCTEMECAALFMNAARAGKKSSRHPDDLRPHFQRRSDLSRGETDILPENDGDCPFCSV